MMDLGKALRLYLVADPDQCNGDLKVKVDAAIRGGVTMVQLRVKHHTDLETVDLAISIREICQRHQVPFLMNDRVDIALAAGADGVHLGVNDLSIEDARSIAGEGFVIGYSPETDTQLRMAAERGADYLGIGPVFTTLTKTDAGIALGTDELARRISLTSLPVVGIGGINAGNFESVIQAGSAGIAVVSAILRADDARRAAIQLS